MSGNTEAVLDLTGVTPTLRWDRMYGSEAEGYSRLQIGVLELAWDPDAAAVIRRKMGGLSGQVASLRAKRRRYSGLGLDFDPPPPRRMASCSHLSHADFVLYSDAVHRWCPLHGSRTWA